MQLKGETDSRVISLTTSEENNFFQLLDVYYRLSFRALFTEVFPGYLGKTSSFEKEKY